MRSHAIPKPATGEGRVLSDAGRAYGLRKNPKKSWKASDSTEIHPMRKKLDRPKASKQRFDTTGALLGKAEVQSGRTDEKENPLDMLADAEPICLVRRKRSVRLCHSPPLPEGPNPDQQPAVPSSVPDVEQVVKELLISLMLLSRGMRDPVDDFMEKIPLPDRLDQIVKEVAFGPKKAPDSDHKEVQPVVNMAHRQTGNNNSENPLSLGGNSKGFEEGCGSSRKKPKREHELKENKNKSKNKIKIEKENADQWTRVSLIVEDDGNVRVALVPSEEPEPKPEGDSIDVDGKKYTCSICLRVYGSGQALGGHKRIHTIKDSSAAKAEVERVEEEPKQVKLSDISNRINLAVPVKCT